ncbi:hypothetical protein DXG01_010496 [Tephrocybe rancida]|nr:hypothetical protein DXG01_010496 [Tephrocybe rancida]
MPASVLEKRAAVGDVATVGYATLNGGTSGGSGGTVTTVTTLAALTSAVTGTAKKIVIISDTDCLKGQSLATLSSKLARTRQSLAQKDLERFGLTELAALVGVGLRVLDESNVIIRNVKISKVLASAGDAIGVQASHQVWLDHLDLSSDRDHDKDFYDGLLDLTHGVTGITVTNSKLYTHWKASLVGHSDSNGAEDTPITVTYAGNNWFNLNSRTPSFRFGHGHIFNNIFDNNNDGINTRDGTNQPLYATDAGFAVATGNDFGGASNTAPVGTFTKAPYSYTLLATSSVRASVTANAGQTLTF